MKNIEYREPGADNIDSVREMCNKLMQYQAQIARQRQDVLNSMSFENRFVPDYQSALRTSVIVAYEDKVPAGFSFATVTDITESNVNARPPWASKLGGLGFYPEQYAVPKRIGTFKLLYVDPNYRGLNIGFELSRLTMNWLCSNHDVEALWVFVANGNEQVGKFYEKLHFTFSHRVFDGFIYAYHQKIGV